MQIEDLVGELIEHLKKLHQESLAKRPDLDERKHPLLPPVPAPAGALNRQPIRLAPPARSNVVRQPEPPRPAEPRRRWF
jgi:hypothetical protein